MTQYKHGTWYPIETAPKIGRIILTNGRHVGEGHYYSLGKGFVYDGYAWGTDTSPPTMWQPLPEPPTDNARKEGE